MFKLKPLKSVLLAVAFKHSKVLKAFAGVCLRHLRALNGIVGNIFSQSYNLRRVAVVILASSGFAVTYLLTATALPAQAATDSTINFQARLETAVGSIAPDGNYDVTFHLFNASSSAGSTDTGCGTDSDCLWEESYTYNSGSGGSDARIRVANGYLTVNLGSIISFPNTINWDQQLWLTMDIGGTAGSGTISWDGQMSPRLQLTSVPYALRAGQLAQFNNATGYTSTLGVTAPTGGNQSFVLPDMGAAGTYTLLTNTTGIQLQSSTPGSQQTGNFNISGTGLLSTLDATGSGTANTLTIGASASSTGAVNIAASATTGIVAIGGTGESGTITIGQYSGAGSSTVSIGANAGASTTQNINIGTSGNGTTNVTIGSSSSTSQTKLQAGATSQVVANTGATIQTTTNTATALQVLNASSTDVLDVDTLEGRVGIYVPASTLDAVAGELQVAATSDDVGIFNTTGVSNNILDLQHGGTNVVTVANAGAATFRNSTDSTAAFQVQKASGYAEFTVDTSGNRVTLGNITTTSGQGIAGSLTLADGTADGFGATLNITTLTASQTITLPNASGTVCLQSSASCGFAPASGSSSYINNTTAPQSANFNVQAASSGTVAGVLQAASSGTADILDLYEAGTQSASTKVLGISYQGNLGFGGLTNQSISVGGQQAANTAGASLTVSAATGNGTGAGGALTLQAGAGGSGAGGGNVLIQGGNAGGGNTNGGNLTLEGGAAAGTGTGGSVIVQPQTDSAAAFQVQSSTGSAVLTIDTTGTTHVLVGGSTCTGISGYGEFCVGQSITGNGSSYTSSTSYTTVANSGAGDNITGKKILISDTSSSSNTLQGLVINESGTTNTAATINSIQATAPVANAGYLLNLQSCYSTSCGSTTNVVEVFNNGIARFKNQTNSTAAFYIQNTSGANLFNADTSDGYLIVGAGTSGDSAPILLVLDNSNATLGNADPTTAVNGAMYYNGSMNSFRCGVNGAWKACDGLDFSETAVSNTISYNNNGDIYTFNQKDSIPYNSCQQGVVYVIDASGYVISSNTDTLYFFVKEGSSLPNPETGAGTTDIAFAAVNLTTTGSDLPWSTHLTITCYSSTSVIVGGEFRLENGINSSVSGGYYNAQTLDTFTSAASWSNDSGGDQLGLGAQFTAANGGGHGITMTQFTVQRVGP